MSGCTLYAQQALLPQGWAHDVRVTLNCQRISAVALGEAPQPQDLRLGSGALLPAPCNLHSHAFQRAMAGRNQLRGPGADSFWSWRELMYRFVDVVTPEQLQAISAQAQVQMCEAGYAAVAEFHYVHHDRHGVPYRNPAEMCERVMAAAQTSGIGLTLLPVFYSAAGADGRAPSKRQLRFVCDFDGYEALMDESRVALRGAEQDWRMGIAPHSLRAVPANALRTLLSAHADGPVHMHIAEQQAEVDEILSVHGARPVQWLLGQHDVDARWCLVHATHIDDDECHALARSGATVGLCPLTEADLGDGVFPAVPFREAGGKLGVGTDSNVHISLTQELRMLEYGQRLTHRARNLLSRPGVSTGRALFEAALAGGAGALHRDSGALAVGRIADLMVLQTDSAELHGLQGDALLDAWIFSSEGRVQELWSAGRHVVREGVHVQRERVLADYRRAIDGLLSAA